MSAAKDALLDLHADILCFQEVRDWDSMAELVSVLAGFHPLVVRRFRGASGPISIPADCHCLTLASRRGLVRILPAICRHAAKRLFLCRNSPWQDRSLGLFGALQEQQRRSHKEHR